MKRRIVYTLTYPVARGTSGSRSAARSPAPRRCPHSSHGWCTAASPGSGPCPSPDRWTPRPAAERVRCSVSSSQERTADCAGWIDDKYKLKQINFNGLEAKWCGSVPQFALQIGCLFGSHRVVLIYFLDRAPRRPNGELLLFTFAAREMFSEIGKELRNN